MGRQGGEERFLEEVRKRLPHLVRSVGEQKARVEHVKEAELRRKERQYLTDTRNNLTNFPHKDLEIEITCCAKFSDKYISMR